MRFRTDYWSADESDDVTSKCREKNPDLLRDMKWLNGVLAMYSGNWNTVYHCCTHWSVDGFIEIPDDAQITLSWYTYFLKLILTEESNDLTLETNTYENFPVCVLFVILLVQGCQNIEWIF